MTEKINYNVESYTTQLGTRAKKEKKIDILTQVPHDEAY